MENPAPTSKSPSVEVPAAASTSPSVANTAAASTSSSVLNSEPTTRRKRTREDCDGYERWPKKANNEAAHVVHATEEGFWHDVDRVDVGSESYLFIEHADATYKLILSNNTFTLFSSTREYPVECNEIDVSSYRKALLLAREAEDLPTRGKDHIIVQREPRERNVPSSDSDDEQIANPEIVPAFSVVELPHVQHMFNDFYTKYSCAITHGFYNALGKFFFRSLGQYANCCCSNALQHQFLHSTSKGAFQPGAFFLKWEVPARKGRTNVYTHERYADAIIYDTSLGLNKVVYEIKEDKDDNPESQSNEQMVGLWKHGQVVMLGLEFSSRSVRPKVLLLVANAMHLFHLPKFDLHQPSALTELTWLITAFLISVKVVKDSC